MEACCSDYKSLEAGYGPLIEQADQNKRFIIRTGEKNMEEKIISIIAEQLSADAGDINMETSFAEDLGADSLDLFELVSALEEEYETEIPSEDLESIKTVGDVVEYLRSKGIEG